MDDWRERSRRAAELIPRGDVDQGAFKSGVVDFVRSREMRTQPMAEIVDRATAVVRRESPAFVPTFPPDLLNV